MAAIQQLTAGDFSCLDRLLSLLYQPDLSASGAVREVVAQLSELLPERAVYVGHLDPAARRFTIVAAVGAERLGLSDGVCVPQEQSFCFHMARKAAPNLSNDAGGDPVYGALPAQQVLGVGSYLGLPLETPEGRPFGSVCAMSRSPFAFTRADRRLLTVFALVLSQIVNRERSAREAAEGAAPSLAVTLGLGSPAGP